MARQVMRVDISLLKRGEPEEDHRLLIKSVAASAAAPKPVVPGSSEAAAQADHEDLSNSVIADLLNFLVLESCPVTPLSVEGGAEAMETTSPEDVMTPFSDFIVFNRFNTRCVSEPAAADLSSASGRHFSLQERLVLRAV